MTVGCGKRRRIGSACRERVFCPVCYLLHERTFFQALFRLTSHNCYATAGVYHVEWTISQLSGTQSVP
jgi:hypothetical protein